MCSLCCVDVGQITTCKKSHSLPCVTLLQQIVSKVSYLIIYINNWTEPSEGTLLVKCLAVAELGPMLLFWLPVSVSIVSWLPCPLLPTLPPATGMSHLTVQKLVITLGVLLAHLGTGNVSLNHVEDIQLRVPPPAPS